jgi:putative ABC transport system permease protein
MAWPSELVRRLRMLLRREQFDRELAEEMRLHREWKERELVKGGVLPEEARYAAHRQFGNTTLLQEESRMAWGWNWLEQLLQDARYGVRMLRKNLGFTTVAVLSLVLGIGANTAIFQLLDAVRMRTLPVQNPQELAEVRIADLTGARGSFSSWHPPVTNPIWEEIRKQQQGFSGIFAWGSDGFNLTTGGEARGARALWVSGDIFNVLGVRPVLGRVFTTADDQRGCGTPGAVISYSFWQREYGGEPSVIGRKLTLDYHPVEIIGVTPASFSGLEVGRSYDVAVPICSQPFLHDYSLLDDGTNWWLVVMGRLKPAWTVEKATAQLRAISPGLFEATLPKNYPAANIKDYLGFKLGALPAGTGISQLREAYSSPLWLLLSITGLVLLIACANLANLMLARASAREKEIAVRLALGATRWRLVRQLMVESLLLAGIGAIFGAILADNLSQLLVTFLSTEGNSLFLDLRSDWRVLAFTVGLAVMTCVLFGLTPALRATKVAPGEAMKAGGRGLTASCERFSLGRALVVSQVALSLVLVAGALLFVRSLRNLMTADTGFQPNGVLITSMDLTGLHLPVERWSAFKKDLVDRLRAIPGVDSAAEAGIVPLSGSASTNNVWLDGADSHGRKDSYFNRIGPDYFKTLQTTLLAGREFDDRDTATSPRVAIINEAFAHQLGSEEDPVGKRFWREETPSEPERQFKIVGIVKNTKYRGLREDFKPIAYLPLTQNPSPVPYDQILMRSNAPLAGLIPQVKRAIGEISPGITIDYDVFETMIRQTLLRDRLLATLSGFFGFLAALLATIGLFGMMSYAVVARTNEIGIRVALGAQRGDVIRMILRDALILVAMGVAIGVPVTLAATRLVSSLLFGLKPADWVSLSLAVMSMLVVAAVAGYIPARRASRVDPMVALHYE